MDFAVWDEPVKSTHKVKPSLSFTAQQFGIVLSHLSSVWFSTWWLMRSLLLGWCLSYVIGLTAPKLTFRGRIMSTAQASVHQYFEIGT